MIPTRVYLPEEMKDALRKRAEERDTSQSSLIREALESFLEGTANADKPMESGDDETLQNLRAARGIWKDRENIHEEFREIRESADRDVWKRVQEHHDDT
jgi:predicted transcriptional regulator